MRDQINRGANESSRLVERVVDIPREIGPRGSQHQKGWAGVSFLSFRYGAIGICLVSFPVALTGCSDAFWEEFETAYLEASGGLQLNVSVDVNPRLQILSIQSEMDSVSIERVTVNRGNCAPYSTESPRSNTEAILAMSMQLATLAGTLPAPANLPKDLQFSQTINLYYPDCDILEVSVVTDQGSMEYQFEPLR